MTKVTNGQSEVKRESTWELLSQPNVWKLLSIPLGALVALIAWLSAGTYLNVQDLIKDNATTRAEIMVLKSEVSMLRTDVDTLKTDVGTLKTDVGTLKTDVGTLKTDVAILKTNVTTLISNQLNMQSDIDRILQLLLADRINALRALPEDQAVE